MAGHFERVDGLRLLLQEDFGFGGTGLFLRDCDIAVAANLTGSNFLKRKSGILAALDDEIERGDTPEQEDVIITRRRLSGYRRRVSEVPA